MEESSEKLVRRACPTEPGEMLYNSQAHRRRKYPSVMLGSEQPLILSQVKKNKLNPKVSYI